MSPIEHRQDYLIAVCGETINLQVMFDMLAEIAQTCKQCNYHKALIDLRNAKGEIRTIDRYDLGKEIAKLIGNSVQIAVVYRSEEIDLFGENVSVNRGANLKVFPDTTRALKWLGVEYARRDD